MEYVITAPTKDKSRYSEQSTNGLKIFNNSEFGNIRTIDINGEPWFVGKDIAGALGYVKERNAISSHVAEEDRKDAPIQGTLGGTQQMSIINESGMYALIFGSKLESAKRFKHWVTSEVLPSIRKNGTYSTQPVLPVINDLSIIKFVADDLRVSEEGRISMYHNYCESIGMTTSFLPQYVENGNRERCSATELLKRNCCELSTTKFNQKLLEYGFLEEKERASTSKGTKRFKSLTEKGLEYGVNLICQKNQKETQPYYYADTFMKLYNMVA